MRTLVLFLVTLTALMLLLPNAAAHPRAVVHEGASGARCYIYTNDTQEPEFWIESNDVTTGGVPGGTPADHALGAAGGGTGLQRAAGPWGNADTQLDALGFALLCNA